MATPAAQPFPIIQSSSGPYGSRQLHNSELADQRFQNTIPIDTQGYGSRQPNDRSAQVPILPPTSGQPYQSLPLSVPVHQSGSNHQRNGSSNAANSNPFKGSLENIEPLPVFGVGGRDPNLPPPLPLIAGPTTAEPATRDPLLPPPLPLLPSQAPNKNGWGKDPHMPPTLPLLPPSLPVSMPAAHSDHRSENQPTDHLCEFGIWVGSDHQHGRLADSRAYSGSGGSVRTEASNLVKELRLVRQCESPEHGQHAVLHRSADNSWWVRKENRFETRIDMESVRDQYLTRQMVLHRNLAKLREITLHEEIKLPVPELVLRGYYEFHPATLKSVKQQRKLSRVPVRERELMMLFMDGVSCRY